MVWYRHHEDGDTARDDDGRPRAAPAARRTATACPRSGPAEDRALFFSFSGYWLFELYRLTPAGQRPPVWRYLLRAWREGLYDPARARPLRPAADAARSAEPDVVGHEGHRAPAGAATKRGSSSTRSRACPASATSSSSAIRSRPTASREICRAIPQGRLLDRIARGRDLPSRRDGELLDAARELRRQQPAVVHRRRRAASRRRLVRRFPRAIDRDARRRRASSIACYFHLWSSPARYRTICRATART